MTFKEILDGIDSDAPARMKKKVPEWSGIPGLEFPTRLSTEQCSSSVTARYKAELASAVFQLRTDRPARGIVTGGAFPQRSEDGGFQRRPDNASAGKPVICDLTGGLGVDCWAFSSIACHVHHNEMDQALSSAVRHNFKALGITNASFSNIEVSPGSVYEVIAACGNQADIIFLDPARRSGTGKKVFLLEDCSPDILALKDELLEAAPDIMVKLSPMADISMICKRLGTEVREVHVVGADGECKELLVWMQRNWSNGCTIVCEDLRFTQEEESSAAPAFVQDAQAMLEAGYLFEPSPAVLKAGCFNLICSRLGLSKLGRFTHLYSTAAPCEGLKTYGKVFSIKEILPFDGRNIKAAGKAYPRCEVTSRNLPISSEELKKKMAVTSGGDIHIFACSASFLSGEKRVMLVTSRTSCIK